MSNTSRTLCISLPEKKYFVLDTIYIVLCFFFKFYKLLILAMFQSSVDNNERLRS